MLRRGTLETLLPFQIMETSLGYITRPYNDVQDDLQSLKASLSKLRHNAEQNIKPQVPTGHAVSLYRGHNRKVLEETNALIRNAKAQFQELRRDLDLIMEISFDSSTQLRVQNNLRRRSAIAGGPMTNYRDFLTSLDRLLSEVADLVDRRLPHFTSRVPAIAESSDAGKPHRQQSKVDAVLLTAIPLERAVALDELTTRGIVPVLLERNDRYHHAFTLDRPDKPPLNCLIVQPADKGSRTTQALVEHLLRDINPITILLVGVAGGLRAKLELGDVVVARQVWDYEPAKLTLEGRHGRPKSYPTSPRLINLVNALYAAGTFASILEGNALYVKDFASGEKTLMDPDSELRRTISDWSTDIFACEMEGPGLMHALWERASGERIECGVIKSISDLGDPDMQKDKEAKQRRAARSAVRVALACLAAW